MGDEVGDLGDEASDGGEIAADSGFAQATGIDELAAHAEVGAELDGDDHAAAHSTARANVRPLRIS